jgi:type IV pilus assembly protein PilV
MCRGNSLDKQRGIVLLEGLIAILIFSFGVLAMVGMQAASVRHTTDAKYRVDASFLANQSIGQMWADRNNLAHYIVTNEDISSLPNGKRTIAVVGREVTVTITWQLPDDSAVRSYSTITQING